MTTGSFVVRPAVIADYDQLCAIWEVGDALHRDALPHMFHASGQPSKTRAEVEALITGSSSVILVAAVGEELIGLITILERRVAAGTIIAERSYAEIDNMAVRQSAQRQGIGRALIKAAAEWAKVRDIRRMELNVYEFNADAAEFYRAFGFAPVSRRMGRNL